MSAAPICQIAGRQRQNKERRPDIASHWLSSFEPNRLNFRKRRREYSIEAGYAVVRGPKGVELACIREDAMDTFSKRTKLIEEEISVNEKKLRASAARMAKQDGISIEDAWAIVKSQVGARNRESKKAAILTKDEQFADWRQQYGGKDWDAMTPEFAKQAYDAGFLSKGEIFENAVKHVFEKRSVASIAVLKGGLLELGEGVLSVSEVHNFVDSDPRFMRHPWKKGITLKSIYEEELQIADIIRSGIGQYQPLGRHVSFSHTLDKAQKEAVELAISNADFAVAVTGLPGAGKTTTISAASDVVRACSGKEVFALAPTGRSVDAMKKAANARDATTIDRLMVDTRLQKVASGRMIFVDEASLMNNEHAKWLFQFAIRNGSRIVLWGDPLQEHAVSRGDPYRDLLDQGLLKNVFLDKIYRQKNPERQLAIKMWHAEKREEAFEKLEPVFRESDTFDSALKDTVDLIVQKIKEGKTTMAIALMHQHGLQIASAVRERLKAEGLLDKQERTIKRLNKVNLSVPQRSDPTQYKPYQVVQFHKAAEGFQPNVQYEISRIENGKVFARKRGACRDKQLPLQQADRFSLYTVNYMQVAKGDKVLFTRNDSKNDISNGELGTVSDFVGNKMVFKEGKSLDISIPVHLRQGYTLTSKSAQAHDADVTVAFLPAEAAAAMSAEQMLVTISRPKDELVITTNSIDVVREYTVQGDDRESARELLERTNKIIPFKQEVKRSPGSIDLQEGKHVARARSQKSKKMVNFCIGLATKNAHKHRINKQIPNQIKNEIKNVIKPDPWEHKPGIDTDNGMKIGM